MRRVSSTLDECALTYQARQPIDVALARRQHERFAETVRKTGLLVKTLPAKSEFPDGSFVEDIAVVLGDYAVICRVGIASRRGEEREIRRFLVSQGFKLIEMEAPATADGGDVLVLDHEVLIGLSSRTNEWGAELIAETAAASGYAPYLIEVQGALHLKTACTYAGAGLLICDRRKLGRGADAIDRFKVFTPPESELVGCNVVRINGRLCIPANCPLTMQAMEDAGFKSLSVDISEFHKAEAGLSCLLLLGS
jgi:dimethylargininase